MVFPVPHLVGEHDRDLIRIELFEQGVIEHDTPCVSEPGEIRVYGPGAAARIGDQDLFGRNAAFRGERKKSFAECRILEGAKTIEQRIDGDGGNDHIQRTQEANARRTENPPAARERGEKPKH